MKACRWTIAAGFSAMMAFLLGIVLTMKRPARDLLLGQGTLCLLGLAALLALSLLALREDKPCRPAAHRGEAAFWLALFALQAALCYFTYFMTGWDVDAMLGTAYALAGGSGTSVNRWYLRLYPNNLLLTLLFSWVMRLFRWLSPGAGLERCTYMLIVMQCALNTLTGLMTSRIALKLTGSRRFSRLTAGVYAVFVGISPWLMIPYSDSMTLVFPVAVLLVYAADAWRGAGKWLLIGLLTGVGTLIKPQAAIVTIALLIVEGMRAVSERRKAGFAVHAGCVLAVIAVLVGPVNDAIIARSGIGVDRSASLGPTHFLMMGLNERTHGMYSGEDVSRSTEVEDPVARRQMQKEEIASRLRAMGPDGLARHLLAKMRVNYGDGSFSWAGEGSFFQQMIDDKDGLLSPLLKTAVGCYGDSASYRALLSWLQAIWLALLAGGSGMALCYAGARGDGKRRDLMLTAMLALGGLTLFVMLFEARARYLYAYAPLYLLTGLCGLRAAASGIGGMMKRLARK